MRCRIPGCCGKSSKWGAYCNSHKIRDRRHGDPEQETITKAIINPYIKIVRKRLEKNLELQDALAERWAETLEQSRRYLTDFVERGVPYVRTKREAAEELIKLSLHVDTREIAETAMAIYVLWDWEPGRFKSDRGFWFQLVRRCRGLAEVNAGSWYDHTSGKTKRVYRDLSPRTSKVMAEIIGDTFGAAGLTIARKETEERFKGELAKAKVRQALKVMA